MSKALKIGNIQIGGGQFALIAGPCTVESESQILEVARSVKQSGASLLRGGAFKGRTSPYDFQGLGEEGIKLLLKAKEATGMPVGRRFRCRRVDEGADRGSKRG